MGNICAAPRLLRGYAPRGAARRRRARRVPRALRPRPTPPGKLSAASARASTASCEDPAVATRTNVLLNKWRAGEVTILQRLYRSARLTGGKSRVLAGGLDRAAFLVRPFFFSARPTARFRRTSSRN